MVHAGPSATPRRWLFDEASRYGIEAYGQGYHVTGPYMAGLVVPPSRSKSPDGMNREDAEWFAALLNRAFAAGREDAQRQMRIASGSE